MSPSLECTDAADAGREGGRDNDGAGAPGRDNVLGGASARNGLWGIVAGGGISRCTERRLSLTDVVVRRVGADTMRSGCERDCDMGGREVVEEVLMSRYFLVVGESGAVKLDNSQPSNQNVEAHLSIRSGSSCWYASNTLRLTFRTSTLASRAVILMIASTSFARDSLSISGGLKQFRHRKIPSVAERRSTADLSLTASARYGMIWGRQVPSIMDNRHVCARLLKTLFGREHRDSTEGRKMDNNGSKSVPRPWATAETSSKASAESLVRSDIMAEFNGRESARRFVMSNEGFAHASPSTHNNVQRFIPLAIFSQESSVSGKETKVLISSIAMWWLWFNRTRDRGQPPIMTGWPKTTIKGLVPRGAGALILRNVRNALFLTP